MPVETSDTVSRTVVRNPDGVRRWIRVLNTQSGMTFRRMHGKPYFSTIPPGTLCAIANGYPIPNKHRPVLGLPPIVKVPANMVRKNRPATGKPRNRRAVNLDDPISAARTIMSAGVNAEYVDELINGLISELKGRK